MNALFTTSIFFFLIILTVLQSKAEPIDDETCLAEYGINSEIYKEKDRKFSAREYYCRKACNFRQDGTMRKNGTIDVEKVKKIVEEEEYIKVFFSIYEPCEKITEPCNLTQCLYHEYDKKFPGELKKKPDYE